MSVGTANAPPSEQGDRLLWLAAGALGLLAVTWLMISQPWSSPDLDITAEDDTSAQTTPAEPSATAASGALQQGRLDNPLRMAELAYEAGMLIEPEDYSAWTLFARALGADADSAEARAGLEAVAAELIKRASVAAEQGRFEDATASVERILDVLSDHAAALELRRRIEAARPAPAPAPRVAVRTREPDSRTRPEARNVAPPAIETEPRQTQPAIDRVPDLHAAFQLAMRENRLLTPAENNAKAHVETMLAENAAHELTLRAQSLLIEELLSRSKQALEALDPEASRSWIDAAESINAPATAVAAARARLDEKLIELESAKPLPASSVRVTEYVPPEYPSRALSRSLEGWVDVEFVVTTDGYPRDIVVTDASHERYFRDEAVEALSQWRFEPRLFHGRLIEQRTYTRIRFDLQR